MHLIANYVRGIFCSEFPSSFIWWYIRSNAFLSSLCISFSSCFSLFFSLPPPQRILLSYFIPLTMFTTFMFKPWQSARIKNVCQTNAKGSQKKNDLPFRFFPTNTYSMHSVDDERFKVHFSSALHPLLLQKHHSQQQFCCRFRVECLATLYKFLRITEKCKPRWWNAIPGERDYCLMWEKKNSDRKPFFHVKRKRHTFYVMFNGVDEFWDAKLNWLAVLVLLHDFPFNVKLFLLLFFLEFYALCNAMLLAQFACSWFFTRRCHRFGTFEFIHHIKSICLWNLVKSSITE